jgi:hypothetical protein
LTDGIKSSGDGLSEKTAYLVNSVGDEYILLNILNIGQDYNRNSMAVKDGNSMMSGEKEIGRSTSRYSI